MGHNGLFKEKDMEITEFGCLRLKKGRTKVCPGGKALPRRGHVSREVRCVWSRSGERCGKEGVFQTDSGLAES